MSSCVYIVPIDMTPESNETLIEKKTIRVLDCSKNIDDILLCSLWNFNLCLNDKKYSNPFVIGDQIKFQYTYTFKKLTDVFFHVINTETGEDITTGINVQVGKDSNLRFYFNLLIDTTNWVDIKCFYVKMSAFICTLTQEEQAAYDACVAEQMALGRTESQAKEICMSSYCAPAKVNFSEPYILATCENTIMIEGKYPGYDCDGLYYGPFIPAPFTPFPYTNSYTSLIRVFGEIFSNQFDVEEIVVNNNDRKSTTLIETFTLMTKQVPYYVSRKIANIFASEYIFVNGIEYSKALTISKNNEDGKMWIIKTTLAKRCKEINFTCNK